MTIAVRRQVAQSFEAQFGMMFLGKADAARARLSAIRFLSASNVFDRDSYRPADAAGGN